jgi:hypothetical protein
MKIQIKTGATIGARAQHAIGRGESREGSPKAKVAAANQSKSL